MKRTLIAASLLLILLAGAWFAGPNLVQGSAKPGVLPPTESGKPALVLTVENPGLFVDVRGGTVSQALVKGRPASLFAPWPKSDRLRVAAFFRGPVSFPVAVGDGPFDLRDLPQLVGGKAVTTPVLAAPWRQVGHYVGQFDEFKGDPVTVLAPKGMAGGAEAADKVRKLYPVAQKLFAGRQPVREQVAVVTGPEPMALARAVVELWVPEFAPDARWWEDGAVEFYAVKLLDQTKSWSTADRSAWMKKHVQDKGYALAIWLDAMLRSAAAKPSGLDALLTATLSARTEAAVIEAVQNVGGVALRNPLERMLQGKDPLPVTTQHSAGG